MPDEGELQLLEKLRRWQPAAPPPALRARVEEAAARQAAASSSLAVRVGLRCGYCHGALPREAGLFCAGCLAPHHAECWDAHGGCTAAGCGGRSAVRPQQRAPEQVPLLEHPGGPRRWRWVAATALLGTLGAAAWSAWPGPVGLPSAQLRRAAEASRQAAIAEALRRAEVRRAAGDLDGALQALAEALRVDNRALGPWLLRGECLLQAGRPRDALEAFGQAIEVAPDEARGWRGHAAARAALGYASEALQDLARALELDPRAVDAHLLRAGLLARAGQLEEALLALDRAVLLVPDHREALLRRAWLVVEQGRVTARSAQALADVTRLLEQEPPSGAESREGGRAEVLRLRAALRAQRGDLPGAEADLAQACALDAPGTEAWTARLAPDARSACLHGQVLLALGRPAEALAAFERALQLAEDEYAAWVGRGRAHGALGSWGEALEDLTEAIDIQPALPEAYYHRAEVHAAQGQEAQARKDYEVALARDPDMGRAQLALARLLQRGDDEQAEVAYGQLLERALASGHRELAAEAHLGLAELRRIGAEPVLCAREAARGAAELAATRRADALAHYEQALQLSPGLRRALLGRARLGCAQGDLPAARRDLEPLQPRAPGDEPALSAQACAWLGLVRLKDERLDLDRAEEAFRRARVLDPGLSLPLAGLGHVAQARGQLEQARALLEAARTIPARARELTRRATHLRSREVAWRAHRTWAAAVADDPLCALAWLGWAELLREERTWDAARAAAERAIAADPFLAEGHLALGRILLRRPEGLLPGPGAQIEGACAALDRAVQLAEGEVQVDALLERGQARRALADLQAALDDLGRAAETSQGLLARDGLHPAAVRRGLACLEALEAAQKQAGDQAGAVRSRLAADALRDRARAEAERLNQEGQALREQRAHQDAIARFDAAIELLPEWADPFYARGTCYLKIGNFVPGILDFSRAVELDPRLAGVMYEKVYQVSYVVDLNRVITELNKIVADHPDQSYVLFLRGFFYVAKLEFKRFERSDLEAGIADFDRTLELNPRHVTALVYRGFLRSKLAELEPPGEARQALHERALAEYRAALALDPPSGLARYLSALSWSLRSADPTLAPARAEECRRAAIQALQEAFQSGLELAERVKSERGFDPIREDPAVRALVAPR